MAVVRRAVAAVPLVLVPALGVTQGGYSPDAWVWAGALAAWGAAVAIVVGADAGALRRAWPWALATAAVALWTILSTIWSAHPAQSVLEARRAVVYVAVVLALLVLARRDAGRLLVPATHAAVSALLAYALARYLLGGRHYDAFEGYLLHQPLGYANAVGILAALGLLLALGIVAGGASTRMRAWSAATVPVLALSLDLSASTASVLALGVGLAVLAIASAATARLLAAAAAVAPAAAIAAALGSASRLTEVVSPPRIPGPALAAAAAACALAAAAVVVLLPLPAERERGRRLQLLVLGAVLVVVLGGAAAAARSGATEPRASYYRVAWHDEAARHPVLGTGAGTFGLYWDRSGKAVDLGGALDAHSLYLETLAELGIPGLVLLLAMLLAPLRRAVAERHRPYVPAALGAYAAFLVHAGLDWDWELPAVVVAALCCAAAVATAALRTEEPLGSRARALVLAAAAALGACSLAGVHSTTVPAASPETERAPRSGALSRTRT
jgi:hypothetical protein